MWMVLDIVEHCGRCRQMWTDVDRCGRLYAVALPSSSPEGVKPGEQVTVEGELDSDGDTVRKWQISKREVLQINCHMLPVSD